MEDISQILSKIEPKVYETAFISIDGHGGSGKSTLARLLTEKLGAEIIRTDDFASWNNPQHWWPEVIEKVFMPIANGALTLSYEPTSWWEHHHPEPVTNQSITPLMILEGVGSSRKEFDEYLSYRIFVDTPKDICRQRGLERDANTGKSRSELETMWQRWFDDEEAYIKRDNPKEKANLIINGTKPFTTQIVF